MRSYFLEKMFNNFSKKEAIDWTVLYVYLVL
ncbi:hypothetical protein BC670_1746 [Flavobacterium branchiophilum]|uniref:Uncharacterized protein n=1 Tax=Flavobacterium branchiophilum TaxID=55197 RepID=A0A543G418_9FLAO|nr:hypothetical protein BC670_1746 [Flavobacterium branchiophilum]